MNIMSTFYSLVTRSIVHSYKAEEHRKSDSKNISVVIIPSLLNLEMFSKREDLLIKLFNAKRN